MNFVVRLEHNATIASGIDKEWIKQVCLLLFIMEILARFIFVAANGQQKEIGPKVYKLFL